MQNEFQDLFKSRAVQLSALGIFAFIVGVFLYAVVSG